MNYGVHCGPPPVQSWVWFFLWVFFFFCSGGQVVTGAAEKVRPLLGEVGISPALTYSAYLTCSGESGLTGVTAGTRRRQAQG